MSFLVDSKDDILPFPWNRGPTSSNGSGSGLIVSEPEPKKLKATNEKQSLYATQWSPRLQRLAAECDGVGCIYLNLCRVNASAGAVLFHAIKVLTSLFKKEEPLIFKIGFTHDPVSRWTSPVYGYTLDLDRNKWTHMIVFYYSKEPFGPAMLEAALIEKFGSTSEWNNIIFLSPFKLFLKFLRVVKKEGAYMCLYIYFFQLPG